MNTIAVFDIGRTNKRFYLFDAAFNIVYHKTARFSQISDDDGFPSEDIERLSKWMIKTFNKAQSHEDFTIKHLNFTAYGATMVHLDSDDNIVAPVYNYEKVYPEKILKQFESHYNQSHDIEIVTASPIDKMQNAGLQLFWLKYQKPELYQKIARTLFLPQYFSWLFTQKMNTDFTSLGYQSMLWDFSKQDFATWVIQEKLDKKLPSIVSSNRFHFSLNDDVRTKVGIGIQNSAAALLPYYYCDDQPFILLSTGTWSIALNPFQTYPLTKEEFEEKVSSYLRYDGVPVKVSKLHLGNEFKLQLFDLYKFFKKEYGYHKTLKFDATTYKGLDKFPERCFALKSIDTQFSTPEVSDLSIFSDFEEAYFKLMKELVTYQVHRIRLIEDNALIQNIYVEGTFAKNTFFLNILSQQLKEYNVYATTRSLATALGAALAIRQPVLDHSFLKEQFDLKLF